MNIYQKITNKEFIQVFNVSISKGDICRKLNIPNNGKSTKYIDNMIKKLSLNEETIKDNYFNHYYMKKICPYCGKEFFTKKLGKESKQICCSIKCSNNYNKNDGRYEKISDNHKSKPLKEHICEKCGEESIKTY